MRTWIIALGLGVLLGLVIIQFVAVDASNPRVTSDVPSAPAVKAILRRASYDCHSNETEWPWYSHIAPVSWLLARDVREGRAELNFSTWDQYTTQQRIKKLKETWSEVAEGEMPPWWDRPAHRDARLSEGDRALLREWARNP
jgi:heme-binding protein